MTTPDIRRRPHRNPIAMDWGLLHLGGYLVGGYPGRFAVDHRAHFGGTPSETLLRYAANG